jgi:4'-phosphopantetheinyl transferase
MLAPDPVLLWVRETADVPGSAAERVLSPPERDRAARFVDATACHEWVASRVILRELLGSILGLEPHAVPIAGDRGGKPYVAGARDVQFSLSRCAGAVAVAVARARPVGVDIERVRHVPQAERIAARYLARADEAAVCSRRGLERDRAFLRGWVAMEAMTKAWGRGVPAAGEYRHAAGGGGPTLEWDGREWSAAMVAGPPGCVVAVAAHDAR